MPGLSVDKFIEICAIMASTRQFGYKRGNLSRLNSVGGLPKTIFALRWANLPHNLGYYELQRVCWPLLIPSAEVVTAFHPITVPQAYRVVTRIIDNSQLTRYTACRRGKKLYKGQNNSIFFGKF